MDDLYTGNNSTVRTIKHWYNFKIGICIKGIAVGIISGLLVVAFRYFLEKAFAFSNYMYALIKQNLFILPIWLLALSAMAVVVGIIIEKVPMSKGSGIPQVEGLLLRQLDMSWWRVIIAKFIGGVLCLGAGLSVGREGPSIQLGAAAGQGFAKIFKLPKIEEKYLLTGGASAGLAAAFNAPLSGVIFSLEEVHKNFSPLVFLTATSAAMTADMVAKEFFGMKPVFNFSIINALPISSYLYLLILGLILGVTGAIFNSSVFATQKLYARIKFIPERYKTFIPFFAACLAGLSFPQVMGGGHELIVDLVNTHYVLRMLLVLLLLKFIFTMLSFSSGVPGGIFLPMLAIGALIGNVFSSVLVATLHFDPQYINNFIVLAMAGYFAAVVRAPITGIVLITEMTGSFTHMLSLTIVCLTAYITADMLKSKPVYEHLLENMLSKKGNNSFEGNEGIKVILEAAVFMGSPLDGKKIREVEWPEKCLLISVKRGSTDIIPNGNTKLQPGDYIVALADEKNAPHIKKKLLKLGTNEAFATVNKKA